MMSSGPTLRNLLTAVVCLSPWGFGHSFCQKWDSPDYQIVQITGLSRLPDLQVFRLADVHISGCPDNQMSQLPYVMDFIHVSTYHGLATCCDQHKCITIGVKLDCYGVLAKSKRGQMYTCCELICAV